MKRLFLLVVLLMSFGAFQPLNAQSFKAYMKAAAKADAEHDYNAAMLYYGEAMDKKPKDMEARYRFAEAARKFHAYELAEKAYQKVLKSKDKVRFPLAAFQLGMVQKQMGKYKAAIKSFEQFQQMSTDDVYLAKAKNEINACQWAAEMAQEPSRFKVEQLNRRVNTPYSEFGALAKGDTLYYSSFRFTYKKDKNKPPRKFTKVLYRRGGSKGRAMRRGFNVDSVHTAHTAFSLDNQRIYFTKCRYVNGVDIRCQIYYREKDRRNRWDRKAKPLSKDINMPGFTATHPAIGYDSARQREILYFTSDRPGGEGNLDIWFSVLNQDGKTFSRPTNLAEVNSAGDDMTPFFHDASQTLYFSSDGYLGLGGYDVFKIKKDIKWGAVENLGAPINSSYNDVYFSMREDEKSGYLSSNRLGSYYLDRRNKTCCNDIYQFTYVEPIPEPAEDTLELAVDIPKPEVVSPSEEKEPETLEDFLPLALYFDNDEPDRRTRRTTTKKAYGDTFEKYYDRKETYIDEYSRPVPEEDQANTEAFMDRFFEEKVRKGYDHLFLFSEILLKRLQEGETVEIFIKGFTSPRAKSDYNLALGKRRVSSLRNHFNAYKDEVFVPFIENSQLKITERSFGEATASKDVSDELEDQRNSIYSVSAARERRVEIVEIKRGSN